MSKPKKQLTPSSSLESDSSLLDPLLADLFEDKEGTSILSTTAPSSFPAGTSGTPTVSFKGPSTSAETSNRNICGICADRQKNSFFVPCGHALCTTCAVFIEQDDGMCPFCKVGVQKVGRLFE